MTKKCERCEGIGYVTMGAADKTCTACEGSGVHQWTAKEACIELVFREGDSIRDPAMADLSDGDLLGIAYPSIYARLAT